MVPPAILPPRGIGLVVHPYLVRTRSNSAASAAFSVPAPETPYDQKCVGALPVASNEIQAIGWRSAGSTG